MPYAFAPAPRILNASSPFSVVASGDEDPPPSPRPEPPPVASLIRELTIRAIERFHEAKEIARRMGAFSREAQDSGHPDQERYDEVSAAAAEVETAAEDQLLSAIIAWIAKDRPAYSDKLHRRWPTQAVSHRGKAYIALPDPDYSTPYGERPEGDHGKLTRLAILDLENLVALDD